MGDATGAAAAAAEPGRERQTSLDVIRGLAALLVLLGHVHILDNGSPTYRLGNFVLLFFPLSGFLVAGPFLRAMVDGRSLPSSLGYAARRCARILPAYWIVLLAIAVLVPGSWNNQPWWAWPVHFSLMQNLVPDQAGAVLAVAWSLGIEALFYICVPIAAIVALRRSGGRLTPGAVGLGLLGLWAFSAVWDGIFYSLGPVHSLSVAHFGLPAYLCAFCPGMLIVVAETRTARSLGGVWAWYRWLAARPALVAVAMAVVWIPALPRVSTSLPVPEPLAANLYFLCGSVGAGLALMLMLHPPTWFVRATRPLAALGVVSYGVYLWHIVVIEAIGLHAHRVVRMGWPALVPVVLALSVALGTASWLFVEKPAIAWANRRFARTTAAAPPAAQEEVGHAAPALVAEPVVETAGTA